MFNEIKKEFNFKKEQEPDLGSYIVLCYVIKSKGYSDSVLKKALTLLVPKDEYETSEKVSLINYLIKITKK